MANPSPAPTGRKTTAQGKAPCAAALSPLTPKNPSPARATQAADPTGLPPGWVQTTLGEINAPSRTRAHPQDEPDLPYVGLEHVQSQTMRLLGRGKTSDLKSSSVCFTKGDVLYGKMRPYLNKVWLAEFDGLCSAEFLVFPKTEGLNGQLFAYRLNSDDFVKFANRLVSGDRPRVDFDKLASFPYPLAPTAEQDRIVAKLDAMLSRLAAGEAAAQRALKRLESYRAAVLHAAVTGELTRQWRDSHTPEETGAQLLKRLLQERRTRWEEAEFKRLQDAGKPPKDDKWKVRYPQPATPESVVLPNIPMTWVWATADQLINVTRPITYGVIKLGSNVPKGVPILRSSDVRHLELDLNGVKCVAHKIADEYRRTYLRGGEVLVTVRGTLGGVVAVPPSCAGYNISREVAMLALLDKNYSHLAACFIASDLLQQWLTKRAKGVAYTGINIETLRQLPLPVVPLAEQAQITREVEYRLKRADQLESTIQLQFSRSKAMRESLLLAAFSGRLVQQDPQNEPASSLLARISTSRTAKVEAHKRAKVIRAGTMPELKKETSAMNLPVPTIDELQKAWQKIGKKPDAKRLFQATGFALDQVVSFYGVLRSAPDIVDIFKAVSNAGKTASKEAVIQRKQTKHRPGKFRLVCLWLEDFKNLKDYKIHFDPAHGLDIILGWNGTGKSNLFEALVIIFRDLHYWWEKNKWPDEPMAGYRLVYEIEDHLVEVKWNPAQMKRPVVIRSEIQKHKGAEPDFKPVKRENLPLPKFVFGYYSGPTNRLAEHFLPMKRDHYDRLRLSKSDDPETLAGLLQQRRFFCAETNHAKYVLLAFSYKEDPKIWRFLEERLRIIGFESALFVIRKPRWAKGKPEDFWGATGIMRRVMEKLKRYAIAPMVLKQKVSDGYRSLSEELYYFFLPDLKSLHEFAAEYDDARSFFLALESTDFSELIHDVKIQVRVKAADNQNIPITFRELSEGEQQLLMVLGLMRFTKSHQSLILLDEPDTHLNPHWSVNYLKDLASVVSDDDTPSPEQQTSQFLMATHDPLVIASLVKDQIHLLKRDPDSLLCYSQQAKVNPRGLGFTGILTSEMFGFRSDLDPETLADLDNRVRLIAKETKLTSKEKKEIEEIDERLAEAGFSKTFSDPYYAAFVRAWGRRYAEQMAGKEVLTRKDTEEIDRIAKEVLAEAVAEVEKEIEAHALR
ncbi:MAG: AAA family ATPase [Verrucomicrobiota bacterium]